MDLSRERPQEGMLPTGLPDYMLMLLLAFRLTNFLLSNFFVKTLLHSEVTLLFSPNELYNLEEAGCSPMGSQVPSL